MKKVVLLFISAFLLFGCSSKKEQEMTQKQEPVEVKEKTVQEDYLFPELITNPDALIDEVHKNNYLHILELYQTQVKFIWNNGENDSNGIITYKENYVAGAGSCFVNNELIDDIVLKIGSEKFEIERLLGPAGRMYKNYIQYDLDGFIKNDIRYSSQIVFGLDKEYKIASIRLLVEPY